jgi:hypothetical protein
MMKDPVTPMKSDYRPNDTDYVIQCRECQAGQMHRRFVAYYTWLGDDLITVPDFRRGSVMCAAGANMICRL